MSSYSRYFSLLVCLCFVFSCSEKEESIDRKINDTGIAWGGDYPKDINEDCSAQFNQAQLAEGESYESEENNAALIAYQDCSQGADASATTSTAFVYQKVAASGEFLDDSADDWACVLDKVSGLLWERKQSADEVYGNRGLQDADDVFTWYNARPKENGGAVGDWNARYNQCTGYTEGQPMSYCNIEELVSRINKHGMCGYQDWRVPTRAELETLVHFGRTMPAVDTDFFPNTKNKFYWTYTPVVGQKTMAWAVSFQFGYSAQLKRDNAQSVRLVRKWSAENEK